MVSCNLMNLIHFKYRIVSYCPGKYGFNRFLSFLCTWLGFFLHSQHTNVGKTLFRYESLLNLAEIADGSSSLASQRGHGQVTTLSIRVDRNRSGRSSQRISASGRFRKGDGEQIPQSSDGNSSNQDEIISLFRRIQSSILKGESISSKKRSSKSSEEKPSAESVLEVLRQSRKQVKAKTVNERGEKVLAIRQGQFKNEDKAEYPSVPDLKFTRPPSNFVKRSPIPSATSPRVRREEKGKTSSATGGEKALDLEKVEEMKLPALKELAKSRGLKGYSKLKKSELIELLRP